MPLHPKLSFLHTFFLENEAQINQNNYRTASTKPGLDHGADHGAGHGLDHGLDYGLDHGPDRGPDYGPNHGPDRGLDHGSDQGKNFKIQNSILKIRN